MTLYNDISMNSSNGLASPIVVKPMQLLGVDSTELLEFAFYMYFPQFHWSANLGAEDQPAHPIVKVCLETKG